MTRFVAFLLALVLPLQSAWAAIAPVMSRVDPDCAQTLTIATHHDHSSAQMANTPDCDCTGLPHSGTHGIVHHLGCAHFGAAMATAASAVAAPIARAGAAPASKHPLFESVVLDVPSPPPTAGA